MHKFTNPMHGHLCYCHLILNIAMYKFVNPTCTDIIAFVAWLTKYRCKCRAQTHWSYINKYIGTYYKIYNHKVNYLLIIAYMQIKKSLTTLTLTVAYAYICNKRLLMVSYMPCIQRENASSSQRQKKCRAYRILKNVFGCAANCFSVNGRNPVLVRSKATLKRKVAFFNGWSPL